jgi:hypothetical protein
MDMSTTQAFRNALQIPLADPTTAEVIIVQAPGGDLYQTYWGAAGGSGSMTPATAQYQVLISGPSPAFAWVPSDTIDCGEM